MNVLRSASKLCADSPMKPGEGLKGWMRDVYDNWIGLSEPGFRSEYPSMYMFCAENKENLGREYDGAAWGALTNIYQSPDPPQWNVAKEFNLVGALGAFRYIR